MARRVMLGVLLVLLATALVSCSGDGDVAEETQPTQDTSDVRPVADYVVKAFADNDAISLAAVASSKGVRFSPYAYVDIANDVVLSAAELERFWTDATPRLWGTDDGTGELIRLTATGYAERFINDRDFTNASSVNINADKARGNTVNNAAGAYPEGTRVEYYVEPTVTNGQPGPDWAALRLVFEKENGEWRLVGVIHDEWTI